MGLFGFFRKTNSSAADATRVRDLIENLGHADAEIRLRACKDLSGLGKGAAAAGPKLQELIDDEDGDVCLAAAEALSTIEHGS